MKTEKEILAFLDEIKQDERISYPTANVNINAPLALIQYRLAGQINTLEAILELPLSKFPLKKS